MRVDGHRQTSQCATFPLHFNKFFKRKVKPEASLDVCIFAKEESDCSNPLLKQKSLSNKGERSASSERLFSSTLA